MSYSFPFGLVLSFLGFVIELCFSFLTLYEVLKTFLQDRYESVF